MQCDCDTLRRQNQNLLEQLHQRDQQIQSLRNDLQELMILQKENNSQELEVNILACRLQEECETIKQLREKLKILATLLQEARANMDQVKTTQQQEKKILFNVLETQQKKNVKLQESNRLCSFNSMFGSKEKCQGRSLNVNCGNQNPAPFPWGQTLLPGKKRRVEPVGKHNVLQCYLGGVLTTAVWDSGSETSMIDMAWKTKHLPEAEIQPLEDFRDKCNIRSVNQTHTFPQGWIGVEFSLPHVEGSQVFIPLLVMETLCGDALIGLNIMNELQKTKLCSEEVLGEIGALLDQRKDELHLNRALLWEKTTVQHSKDVLKKKLKRLKEKHPAYRHISCEHDQEIDSAEEHVNHSTSSIHPAQLSQKEEKIATLAVCPQLLKCSIGGVQTRALWDTGACVSAVSLDWKNKHLPDVKINSLQELGFEQYLLSAANGTSIPFAGCIQVDFSLPGGTELSVPFIVFQNVRQPIIGTNIIDELSHCSGELSQHYLALLDHGEQLKTENRAHKEELDRQYKAKNLLQHQIEMLKNSDTAKKRQADVSKVDAEEATKKKRCV